MSAFGLVAHKLCDQHMRATRVSVSLLGQAILASILAWWFLDEQISVQMIIGGFVLLLGIRLTFYEKPFFKHKVKVHS